MAVRIVSVLYDDITSTTFGPVFGDPEQVQAFVDWLPEHPLAYTTIELKQKAIEWVATTLNRKEQNPT